MDETRRAQLDRFRVKSLFDGKEGLLKKYKTFMVGDQGWWALIKYELIITLFGWIPGALGLALRSLFFPFLFKKVGKKVVFGRDMNIRSPHKIEIGDQVIFDDDVLLDAKGSTNNGIRIGNDVYIGQSTIIQTKNGDPDLGRRGQYRLFYHHQFHHPLKDRGSDLYRALLSAHERRGTRLRTTIWNRAGPCPWRSVRTAGLPPRPYLSELPHRKPRRRRGGSRGHPADPRQFHRRGQPRPGHQIDFRGLNRAPRRQPVDHLIINGSQDPWARITSAERVIGPRTLPKIRTVLV